MFISSVEAKVNRYKINAENFLNYDKKKEQIGLSNPSVKRSEPVGGFNFAPSQPTAIQKAGQMQLRKLMVENKQFQKGSMNVKIQQKQKIIQIYFQEEKRQRLDITVQDANCKVRVLQDKVQISYKKMLWHTLFKMDTGEQKWMVLNESKEDKVTLYFPKDNIKLAKPFFQAILPEQKIVIENSIDTVSEVVNEEVPQDVVSFPPLTPQQMTQLQKLRKNISKVKCDVEDMRQEDKMSILLDIFKIKKQYDDGQGQERKKRCPVHSCQKVFRELPQMRTHLKKHPQLAKHGIQLTDYNSYEYSQKAIDMALFLGKVYPQDMKKIIRKMKTKSNIQ